MSCAGSQPTSRTALVNRLVNCCHALSRSLAGLEGDLQGDGSCPGSPDPAEPPQSEHIWEGNLAEIVVQQVSETVRPPWALIHLCNPATKDFSLSASIGLKDAGASQRVSECLWTFLQVAVATPQPIQIADLQNDKRYAALVETLPRTHSLLGISLSCDDKVVGAITLGFEAAQSQPSPVEIGLLAQAGRHVGGALLVYRRLAKRIAGALAESEHTTSGKVWQPGTVRNARGFSTLSLAISSGASNGGSQDFCAAASSRTDDVRLFVSRLEGQGQEMAWETLALDIAFRAACVLYRHPAGIVDIMNRAWVGAGGRAGSVRFHCCADAANSGREYVFAGTASHLLYENRKQRIAELYERLPESDGAAGVWDGQHVPLHSGDVLILHTCDLPHPLPKRHDVHRRLAAILACEGRRPIETVARHVNDLLCTGGTNQSPVPVVALLRAE